MRIRTVVGSAVLFSIVSLACSGGKGPTDPDPVMCSYPGLTHLEKSDPRCVPPPPNPTIDITLNSTSGIVGDTINGTATATNYTTCTLNAGGATLLSGSNCGPFKIVLTVAGTATVSGSATGATGTQPASVVKSITVLPKPVVTVVTFTGKIILLNAQSGDSPKDWNVSAQVFGEEKVSAVTNENGEYTLPSVKDGPVRETIITLVPPSGSRFGPMYLTTTTQYASTNMKWTALPNAWRISKGIYTGESIPVSLIELLSHPQAEDGNFFTAARAESVGPSFGYYNIPNWWYFGGYPIKVAIDRIRTTSPLGPSDSIKFWSQLDEFERITGFDYYVPANYSEVVSGRRGYLFYIDSTITFPGVGLNSTFLWDPRAIENDWAVITGVRIHDLGQFYREDIAFNFPRLIQHEFIHGLGFNHTDSRFSLMNNNQDGYALSLTVKDVAYLELVRELTLAQKTYNTRLGLAERLNGMYVIEQSRAPTAAQFLP
jgi:hypothetical protein